MEKKRTLGCLIPQKLSWVARNTTDTWVPSLSLLAQKVSFGLLIKRYYIYIYIFYVMNYSDYLFNIEPSNLHVHQIRTVSRAQVKLLREAVHDVSIAL